MTPRTIGTVLLIDDAEADNYLHGLALAETGIAPDVETRTSGDSALDYLNRCIARHLPLPALILLDINMPGMTGWEFLDAYVALPESARTNTIVVMATASGNPADKERADSIETVDAYRTKPLTAAALLDLVAEFFAD